MISSACPLNVCGHPELVTDYENGLLILPQEPKLLERKLLELLTDDNLKKKLGENARTFITGKWGNFSDNAKILYNVLKTE